MGECMIKEKKKIVRIAGTDINGSLPIERGLRKIKGISFAFAHAIRIALNKPRETKINELSKEEIKKIESMELNIPSYLLNRRRDIATGNDTHLISAKVDFVKREDIERLKRIKCYRGVRHGLGLPVRGQRTRSTFRKGRAIGVSKKKQER